VIKKESGYGALLITSGSSAINERYNSMWMVFFGLFVNKVLQFLDWLIKLTIFDSFCSSSWITAPNEILELRQ
jgi:hypothetical protein